MATKASLLVLMIAATAIVSAVATDYMVGDSNGWSLEVNYTNWAQGKDFHVGDRLIFVYNKDFHNVAKVNGTQFQQCAAPDSGAILTTGNDTITLGTPGKKWYLCSVNDHCSRGMKLVISVSALDGPAPAQLPGSWDAAPNPGSWAPTPKTGSWAPASTPTSGIHPMIPGSWAPAPAPDTSGSQASSLKSFVWVIAILMAFYNMTMA